MAAWDEIKIHVDGTIPLNEAWLLYDFETRQSEPKSRMRWIANPVRPGSAWDEWLQLAGRARRKVQGQMTTTFEVQTNGGPKIDQLKIDGETFSIEEIRKNKTADANLRLLYLSLGMCGEFSPERMCQQIKRSDEVRAQDQRLAWARVSELDRKLVTERVESQEKLDALQAKYGELEKRFIALRNVQAGLQAKYDAATAPREIAGQRLATPPESTYVTLGMLRELVQEAYELRGPVCRHNRSPLARVIDEKLGR